MLNRQSRQGCIDQLEASSQPSRTNGTPPGGHHLPPRSLEFFTQAGTSMNNAGCAPLQSEIVRDAAEMYLAPKSA